MDVYPGNASGTFSSWAKFNGTQILYYRKREQFTGRFSAKDYPVLAEFYTNMYKADRTGIVLVKKE